MEPAHFDLRGAQGVQINTGAGGVQVNRFTEGWRRPILPALTGREVPRPELMDRLVDLVLAPAAGTVAMATALRGAGGFGKTTLARMLAHDPRLRDRFPDGIVWVTFGSDLTGPDLANEINGVCALLTGAPAALPTPVQAGAELARRIGDRRVLLVLDDVWLSTQLEPFLFAAENVVRLVTTRDSSVLPPATESVLVDAMSRESATRLVAENLPDVEADVVDDVLAVTGRWPLLLSLVNGAAGSDVAAGRPVTDALAEILTALHEAGPTVLDVHEEGRRDRAITTTMEVSLARLTDDERLRYEELAVFGEDVEVPRRIIERFWAHTGGWTPFQSHRFCRRLADMSLAAYPQDEPRLLLHDVVRAYLHHNLSRPARDLHAAFLAAQADPAEPAWPHGSVGELFLWQWIPTHLAMAGKDEQLKGLLLDPGFLIGKLQRMNPAAVESDFTLLDDPVLTSLAQTVRQNAHLLGARPVAAGEFTSISSHHVLANTLAAAVTHRPLRDGLLTSVPAEARLPVDDSIMESAHPALVRVLARGDDRPVDLRYLSTHDVVVVAFLESVRVYDRFGKEVHRVLAPEGSLMELSGDGSTMAVSLPVWERCLVEVYATASGTLIRRIDRDPFDPPLISLNHTGAVLAIAGRDRIAIFDLTSKKPPRTVSCPRPHILAFTTDGAHLLLIGGRPFAQQDLGVVSLLSQDIRSIRTPARVSDCVVATAPAGTAVAALAYEGGGAGILRIAEGLSIEHLSGRDVRDSLTFSGDGRRLMAYEGRELVIWDMNDLSRVERIGAPVRNASNPAISSDGRTVVLGHERGISVFDRETGSEVGLIGAASPHTLIPARDANHFVSADAESVSVWQIAADSLPVSRHRWTCAVANVDENVLLASADGYLDLRDSGGSSREHARVGGRPTALFRDVTGGWAAVRSDSGIFVWRPGREPVRLHDSGFADAALKAAGHQRLVTTDTENIQIWDVAGEPRKTSQMRMPTDSRVLLATPTDGRWFAAAGYGNVDDALSRGQVIIRETASGLELGRLPGTTHHVWELVADPHGYWLVAFDADGVARTFDVRSMEISSTRLHHENSIICSALHPDATTIAAGAYDEIVIWRVRDHTADIRLRTSEGGLIIALAWSPDGVRLAVARQAGSLEVWNVAERRMSALLRLDCSLRDISWYGNLITMNGSRGPVLVRLSPDG
ncbi:NB-ARC domain-containing protein [Actinoplanes sp. NPDC051861]|uniref:NB-ARC domain-containing protein n=1 Tax=Actinoplanes sp. NPDC051861 TaxID=3155170 RepID=UPI00341E595D